MVALTLAQAGEVCLAILFGVFTVLLIVGTLSALLPGLHRLPGIGAPRLSVEFTANGSPDLLVAIPPAPEHGERPVQSVLIRVGVRNRSRPDVAHTLLNFCVPVGHGLQLCDHRGEPFTLQEGRGGPMPPTQEPNSFDYWALGGVRLTGRNSRLFHFRIRIDKPGDYPLKLRLQSRELYREFVADGLLRVEERSVLPTRDALSGLIDKGEKMLRFVPDEVSDGSLRVEAMAFVYETTLAIEELNQPALRTRLDSAILDYAGPKAGDDYYRALLASKVRVLYDIRDLPNL